MSVIGSIRVWPVLRSTSPAALTKPETGSMMFAASRFGAAARKSPASLYFLYELLVSILSSWKCLCMAVHNPGYTWAKEVTSWCPTSLGNFKLRCRLLFSICSTRFWRLFASERSTVRKSTRDLNVESLRVGFKAITSAIVCLLKCTNCGELLSPFAKCKQLSTALNLRPLCILRTSLTTGTILLIRRTRGYMGYNGAYVLYTIDKSREEGAPRPLCLYW